jgi:nicotinamidase-related amidase
MGKVALVVTDMINDFINPAGALYVGPAGPAIIPFVAGKVAPGDPKSFRRFFIVPGTAG